VFFTTDYVQAGAGGLGVLFSGKPFDKGGVHLDYGLSRGTRRERQSTGTFRSYERVKAFGAGCSAVRVIENMLAATGRHAPRLSRYVDVSAGITSKHTDIAIAGDEGPVGKADSRDWGWLARVTPYDGLERDEHLPLRVDATYGRSDINYHLDDLVVFIDPTRGSPVTRQRRRGATARVSMGRVPHTWGPAGTCRMLLRGLRPLASVTYTDDHVDVGVLDEIEYATKGRGWEVTLANMFSYRRGHYQDLESLIDGDTWAMASRCRSVVSRARRTTTRISLSRTSTICRACTGDSSAPGSIRSRSGEPRTHFRFRRVRAEKFRFTLTHIHDTTR
jgi:hypothetical protein